MGKSSSSSGLGPVFVSPTPFGLVLRAEPGEQEAFEALCIRVASRPSKADAAPLGVPGQIEAPEVGEAFDALVRHPTFACLRQADARPLRRADGSPLLLGGGR